MGKTRNSCEIPEESLDELQSDAIIVGINCTLHKPTGIINVIEVLKERTVKIRHSKSKPDKTKVDGLQA